jgi:hypothetical protein
MLPQRYASNACARKMVALSRPKIAVTVSIIVVFRTPPVAKGTVWTLHSQKNPRAGRDSDPQVMILCNRDDCSFLSPEIQAGSSEAERSPSLAAARSLARWRLGRLSRRTPRAIAGVCRAQRAAIGRQGAETIGHGRGLERLVSPPARRVRAACRVPRWRRARGLGRAN